MIFGSVLNLLPMSLILNYKSIGLALRGAISAGLLFELKPSFVSDPVERVMLLHSAVDHFLHRQAHHSRIGRLRGDLESFVMGQEIAISAVPHEHRTAYMGILDPKREGIWEIRSRDPNPGMRVFGHFACKDTFVALGVSLRSRNDQRWPELVPLGNRDSLEYQLAQIGVIEKWKSLFPQFAPLTGDDVSVLLSDKYHII